MSFSVNSIAGGSHAPEEVRRLAEEIGRKQDCPVLITSEASGYHIYIPCHDCLKTHGKRELQDPKYAINASKYLGLGVYRKERPGSAHLYENDDDDREIMTSVCMRTCRSKRPHRYKIRDLKQMGTVLERYPEIMQCSFKLSGGGATDEAKSHWETDPVSGQLCPPPPGVVVPLTELGDPFHPAIEYLARRNFDIEKLQYQFRCGFCTQEYKHGVNGIYHRQLPGAWRDTPQHRIVFYSLINGAPMTWQARVLEKLSDDGLQKLMLHPYKIPFQWDVVAVRPTTSSNWIYVPPFDAVKEGVMQFNPSKYRTAKFSSREMMGWDAACKRADEDPEPLKWVVLCEGPLDAARVGPGGVAAIGASLSPEHVNMIASRFHIVFTAFDTDKAGRMATEKIGRMLFGENLRNSIITQVVPLSITGGKDIGDMTQPEFDRMFEKARGNVSRQY